MIVTAILLLFACIFFAGYALKGERFTKRSIQIDKRIYELTASLRNPGDPSASHDLPEDAESLRAALNRAFHERGELDERISIFHDNVRKMSIWIAIISILTVVAVLLG